MDLNKFYSSILNPFILPVTGGLLTAAAFPDWNLWIFAWIALVPVLFAIEKATSAQVFRRSFLFAFTGFVLNLAWIRHTMIDYGGISVGLAVFLLILLAMYCALYSALALWMSNYLQQRLSSSRAMILPPVWVTAEYLRTHLITGFPWNALGQSQYKFLPILQNADWGSFYAVSFIVVLVNIAFYQLIRIKRNPGWCRDVIVATVILFAAVTYGFYRLHQNLETDKLTIGIVQGNVDQLMKWDIESRSKNLNRHIVLSKSLLKEEPDIIVWPESAITFYYRFGWRYTTDKDDSLGERLADFVKKSNIPLLLGTLDQIDGKTYNSACLILPSEIGLESYYHKIHLVPFGEYVPLQSVLFFVDRLVEHGIGQFHTGSSAAPLRFDSIDLGITICYENIFPSLVRKRVLQGADIICNLTNDTWFGKSAAPMQHLSASAFRAVENRRPVIRAANTGYSGAYDSDGKLLFKSNLFQAQSFTVPIHLNHRETIYTRLGDVFAWLCICFTLLLVYFTGRD